MKIWQSPRCYHCEFCGKRLIKGDEVVEAESSMSGRDRVLLARPGPDVYLVYMHRACLEASEELPLDVVQVAVLATALKVAEGLGRHEANPR